MTKGEPNMVLFIDWGQFYVGAHVKNGSCTLFAIDNVASGCVDCPYLNPKQSGDIVYKIFVAPEVYLQTPQSFSLLNLKTR